MLASYVSRRLDLIVDLALGDEEARHGVYDAFCGIHDALLF
jgi:hypothetical protein